MRSSRPARSSTAASTTRFFTYKGGDLAHPVPLLVQSWKASKDAKTFTFNLEERPLRGRDAAHCRGRRLLVQPADQPQGQPVVPAGRRHRLVRAGKYTVVLQLEGAERGAAVDPDEHVARDRQLEAREGTAARARSELDKTDKAEKWLNSAASRGAGSGPYLLQRYSTTSQVTLVAEPALLGREEGRSSRPSSSAT